MQPPPAVPGARAWPEAFFRIATSLIFIVAGLGHLVRAEAMAARLLDAPLGRWLAGLVPVAPMMFASGVVLIAGGSALALGYRTRWAALALIAVLVPITATTHIGHGGDPGPLLKNVALLGSLVHLAAVGAGRWSLDRRASRAVIDRQRGRAGA